MASEEVMELLSPLVSLRIALFSISPQLLDLFSVKLKKLSRLEVVVKYVLPHVTDESWYDKRESQVVSSPISFFFF